MSQSNILAPIGKLFIQMVISQPLLKDKDQLWSCDCIVKELLWNRSEKVDHLAYMYISIGVYCKVLESSK